MPVPGIYLPNRRRVGIVEEREHYGTLRNPVPNMAPDYPACPGNHARDVCVAAGRVTIGEHPGRIEPSVHPARATPRWCWVPRVALGCHLLTVRPNLQHSVRPQVPMHL